MKTAKKKELTQKEVAKMGGDATKEKYGAKHFKKMAKARWEKKGEKKKVGKK